MRNIYYATDKQKEELIDIENEEMAYYKRWQDARISDLVMIRETSYFPFNGIVKATDESIDSKEKTLHWTLNGANLQQRDFIIIEPFEEQINNQGLVNINEANTWFEEDVVLSKKAIILMPEEKYFELCKSNKFKKNSKNLNIVLYKGDKNLALKMLLLDKRYVRLNFEDSELRIDEYPEVEDFGKKLKLLQRQIADELQRLGRNVTYGEFKDYIEGKIDIDETLIGDDDEEQTQESEPIIENLEELKSKMITGLTPAVEGDIELDEICFATTAIGKRRENQEDAVLLIKDEQNPNFKMIVVADGMGGEQQGEFASNTLIEGLKQWFEGFSDKERQCYYDGVLKLQESLNDIINEISNRIVDQLYGLGGTTLVCAIIGEYDTLITNVGDSRAYIIKKGKLEQVTIDDSIVQEESEKGNIPYKDAMRFHREAAGITECVGMGTIKDIHSTVLSNVDYDVLLLFSDGVTDCLSEEDIAVICKKSDRKKIAKLLVQKAIANDSIAPDELIEEYVDFNVYIPGGKDNTTTALYINKNVGKDEEKR